MKRFKIWKASVTEYRIKDNFTNEVKVLDKFTLVGCEFKVNLKQYHEAKQINFENSGNPFDFFAWIEADTYSKIEEELPKKVFYNPFRSPFFRDRESSKVKQFATKIVINGNTLSYE